MDPTRAERMKEELTGTSVGGWSIISYVGAGKSALVFLAENEARRAALKIFDPELVQRFGKQTQLTRISREVSLIGESHPNLVEIYDGGECSESGYLYVAMQYFQARNLEDAILDIPREKIASLIVQVASATIFLEERGLAHRDIKPSNIVVTKDFETAILLDLGVLRPFGDPGLTDDEGRVFIGTLQYSSPEFLMRTEQDKLDGWRAISFYQLGGVLHDLIMRQPLFSQFVDPYAVLVEAVKSEQPQIYAEDVSPDLVLLAQNCLVKSPESRLALVSWDDFRNLTLPKESAQNARDRVRKRSLSARVASDGAEVSPQEIPPLQLARQITEKMSGIVRLECAGNSSFPRMRIIEHIEQPLYVQVIFDSSSALMVPRQFSVRLSIQVIDEPTMAVQINVSACLLDDPVDHSTPATERSLFRGPLDFASLVMSVQDILYEFLDVVQSTNPENLIAGVPYWLEIIDTKGK
ncbi:Serine/threonine-protein kinase PknJ [Gimesia alba]|uniref:Serine/threonine-protein kinase PknJ n=1 Tax=Gimesia alba TaxID=2527973 RepID=A0A517RHZ4_9PLAN|nr:serine/threonine-protein kinase [Gimesia alba]QDT43488.1 Serine/threonine-protein kinase PknJ [Gimesia alba]